MDAYSLSVVIPLFNEEHNIEPLLKELVPLLTQLNHFSSYEIIMVNDGSSDRSWEKIISAADTNKKIKGVSFTRNFGHEYATTAGIHAATGDAVILIDADLQDPPELIFDFEREWKNGYDVVYGKRMQRLEEPFIKKASSKFFYPFFRFLTNIDMPRDVGDFCLLSRKAVDIFTSMPERTIFVRGLIYWPGLPKKEIPFIRRKRNKGKSKYNYSKLAIFALENIVSFSITPIYYLIFLSFFMILLCCIGTIVALGMHYYGKVIMTGWTSLIICNFMGFSSTFFILGLLGLYIGKIFQEVKQRPQFLINKKIGFHDSKPHE